MKLPIALATLALLGVAPQPGREIPARTWLHWIGETPDLEDLRGRTVLLHFMSTNPDPKIQAKAHWPVVQKHHHEFADKGVVFIGLCRESAASVRTYMGEHIIPFPVGCGADEAWSEFGVASEFHEILIDKDRRGGLARAGERSVEREAAQDGEGERAVGRARPARPARRRAQVAPQSDGVPRGGQARQSARGARLDPREQEHRRRAARGGGGAAGRRSVHTSRRSSSSAPRRWRTARRCRPSRRSRRSTRSSPSTPSAKR